MKNDIISNLSKDLKPWAQFESRTLFLSKWSVLFIIFIAGNLAWMPWREGVMNDFSSVLFNLENVLWFGLTLTSALALYESVFPENKSKGYGKISFSFLLTLLALTIFGRESAPVSEWVAETTTVKGRCGLIISLFAVVQTPVFVSWARKAAPKDSGMTGYYAALSSASMGILLMQIVCVEVHSFHVIFWHFVPLAVMCFGSYALTKKFLHW